MIRTDRIERVQELMREKSIDAYLILTHDDYMWFFGEDRYQPRAIIPADAPPVIVTFTGEEAEVREHFRLDDVKVFASVGQQIKDVVQTMRAMKGDKDTLNIGIQLWFDTPAFLVRMFSRANPFVEVVDIATVMDDLRMIKEPDEVELIQQAAGIADIGMRAAVDALCSGVTENDVAAEAEYAMRKAGGSGTATPIYVNSGARSGWLHGTATHKTIEEGDLVVVDLVPRYLGYCANLCRTFVVGDPTAEQARMFEVYRRAQEAAIGAMAPGISIREIDAVAQAIFEEGGYGEHFVYGLSHGIGLQFEEKPASTIKPAHATVRLVENMVQTCGHSVLSVPGIGGVRLEDTTLITGDGAEVMTQFPKPLVAL